MTGTLLGEGTSYVVLDLFGTLGGWAKSTPSSLVPTLLKYCKSPSDEVGEQMAASLEATLVAGRQPGLSPWDYERERWRHVALTFDLDVTEPVLFQELEQVVHERRLLLYSDALPFLEALKQRGVAWVLCTNAGPDVPDKFEALIGTELAPAGALYSSLVGFRKPREEMYQALIGMVTQPERCVFIGDSLENDVHLPQSLGFHAVHLLRRHLSRTPSSAPTIALLTDLLL